MGASQSTETDLIRPVSPIHKQKVDPLLRANHKHMILLDTAPAGGVLTPSCISQILTAATLLKVVPVTCLFDIWDLIARDTRDVGDAEQEIVESDFLDPTTLGDAASASRYVDFFDDEIVRHKYYFDRCVSEYLRVPQVVDGLLANQGWAVRQLSCAFVMQSKEMCAEALGGALAFYAPLEVPSSTKSISSQTSLVEERQKWIDAGLRTATTTTKHTQLVLLELLVLDALSTLDNIMPTQAFTKLWTYQTNRLAMTCHVNIDTLDIDRCDEDTVNDDDDNQEVVWAALVSHVALTTPHDLPYLRLLHDYPRYGLRIARQLYT